jgi:ATP phosphoribosyltransferase regulatory subunit
VLTTEARVDPARLAAIRAPFEAFGGEALDAPVLMPLSRLLDVAGEALRAHLFVVQSEQAEEQALRPDFTVAAAMAHIGSGRASGRYRYEGKAFIAQDRGSNAPTEFLQIGVEQFGPSPDPAAEDAAIVALAWTAARAGGRSDLALRLGDPGLFSKFLDALGVAEPHAQRLTRAFGRPGAFQAELHLAKAAREDGASGRLAEQLILASEAEAEILLQEIWRLSGIQPVGGRTAGEIIGRLRERAQARRAPPLTTAEADLIARFSDLDGAPDAVLGAVAALGSKAGANLDQGLQDWRRRLDLIAGSGVAMSAMRFTTRLVRPFGYYDGMLFEILSPRLAEDAPIAGGGRYDKLPARLGGSPGAVGCMIRPGRALEIAL